MIFKVIEMRQTKKILIFGMTSETGGVESFIMNYVRHMVGNGIEFDFLAYNRRPAFSEEIESLGGKIIVIPGRGKNPFKCISAIKHLLKKTKYDAVWSNLCYLSDVLLLKYAKKSGVPTRIIHAHNNVNMSGKINGFLHNCNRKKIGKIATDFWCCSDSAGEFFYPESVRSGEKYRVIPNAIDTEKFTFDSSVRESKRKELGIADKFVIGNVGRFHFQKNHMFLLEIFNQVCLMHQDSVLLLIGDGEIRPQIESKIEELGLENNVILLGRRGDVNELMCAMDVFLLPSLFEGLGIVLIEAQCSGLYCFASSNNIPQEAKVTDLLDFIDLNSEPKIWAEEILKAKNLLRKNHSSEVKESGYDIKVNSEKLYKYFIRN